MVAVRGNIVQRFSAVTCVASLTLIHARARRLHNHLIHLFLIQLWLFRSVDVL